MGLGVVRPGCQWSRICRPEDAPGSSAAGGVIGARHAKCHTKWTGPQRLKRSRCTACSSALAPVIAPRPMTGRCRHAWYRQPSPDAGSTAHEPILRRHCCERGSCAMHQHCSLLRPPLHHQRPSSAWMMDQTKAKTSRTRVFRTFS